MKKLLLSLAAAAIGYGASAQISAGTIAIGGDLKFASETPKGGKSGTGFGLGVNGAYFLQDGLELNVRLGFTGEDKSLNVGPAKGSFRFGVGAAKYFELATNFYLTAGAGLDYLSQDFGGGSQTDLSINIAPGFAWFPAPKWGISLSTSPWLYFHTGDAGNGFGLNPNVGGIGLGVRYFMTK